MECASLEFVIEGWYLEDCLLQPAYLPFAYTTILNYTNQPKQDPASSTEPTSTQLQSGNNERQAF